MSRKTVAAGGTRVQWEEQSGGKWNKKQHTFGSNVRVGAVLKEMRAQSNLRNITLVKE